ncbi:hypothetical protein K1X76_05980 [bacterium]|nr:hypothetical protein [bacterium]
MKNLFAKALFFLWAFSSILPFSFAGETPVKRTILVFYDDKIYPAPFYTDIHQYVESSLNHLGLKLMYWGVNKPLPNWDTLSDVRGILSWFKTPNVVPNTQDYCNFLNQAFDRGVKMVVLSELGFLEEKASGLSPVCSEAFKRLGGIYTSEYSDNPYFFELVYSNPKMMSYERKLLFSEPIVYRLIKPARSTVTSHLTIRRTDLENSDSSMVFTSENGGYAQPTHAFYMVPDIKKQQWRVNPFLFFEEAYGLQGLPIPDTTTINGNRIFYSHIDGDGIVNLSNIDRKSYDGEIIYNEILKKYSSIPITASLITGYFDMPEFNTERIQKLYQNIYSLPNIEPSSHGYAHPLDWKKETYSLKIADYRFDEKKEIATSAEKMNQLLKKMGVSKKVDLFEWTGNCLPTDEQARVPSEAGLANINGGDSRFDRIFDSVSYVAPLGLNHNGIWQIYASNSNENTYTNRWKGPYYGYQDVIETFQNTNTPKRIKPLNVYYHFYSGEYQASLKALKKAYDYALAQSIFAITASRFSKLAQGFYSTQIAINDSGGYVISNHSHLKTIRFDNTILNVDLVRSRGVLGFHHDQGNLYVFLNDEDSQIIYLTGLKPGKPYIVQSTFDVMNWDVKGKNISFEKKGWHKSRMSLGGLPSKARYLISYANQEAVASASQDGILDYTFPSAENEKEALAVNITLIP